MKTSKYKHFFVCIVKNSFSESLEQLLTPIEHNFLNVLKLFFSKFCIFQLQSINFLFIWQVRNNQFIFQIKFLFFIGVNQDISVPVPSSTRNQQITHCDTCLSQTQRNRVYYCTFGTALVFKNTDSHFNLTLLILIVNDQSLKTFSQVLSEL